MLRSRLKRKERNVYVTRYAFVTRDPSQSFSLRTYIVPRQRLPKIPLDATLGLLSNLDTCEIETTTRRDLRHKHVL